MVSTGVLQSSLHRFSRTVLAWEKRGGSLEKGWRRSAQSVLRVVSLSVAALSYVCFIYLKEGFENRVVRVHLFEKTRQRGAVSLSQIQILLRPHWHTAWPPKIKAFRQRTGAYRTMKDCLVSRISFRSTADRVICATHDNKRRALLSSVSRYSK